MELLDQVAALHGVRVPVWEGSFPAGATTLPTYHVIVGLLVRLGWRSADCHPSMAMYNHRDGYLFNQIT